MFINQDGADLQVLQQLQQPYMDEGVWGWVTKVVNVVYVVVAVAVLLLILLQLHAMMLQCDCCCCCCDMTVVYVAVVISYAADALLCCLFTDRCLRQVDQ